MFELARVSNSNSGEACALSGAYSTLGQEELHVVETRLRLHLKRADCRTSSRGMRAAPGVNAYPGPPGPPGPEAQ